MTLTAKPTQSGAEPEPNTLSRWEERSTHRVLEARRDQILERSRRIVEAAYALHDDYGLEGLTIRAVLKKTGLSRRAFYERFADKDELVLAVFEQTIRLATDLYREQVLKLSDPLERLRLIITCIVLGATRLDDPDVKQNNRRGAAMSREHLRLAESRPNELQAAVSPLIDLIAEQLAAGMNAGVVRTAAPERMAAFIYNLVSTTVHTELLTHESTTPDRADRSQLAQDIWEFCRRAIAL